MPHSTEDLAAIAHELRSALLHGDAATLDALLDEEFSLAGVAGSGDREVVLAAVRPGALALDAIEIERERIRVFGELGVTDTLAQIRGTYEGAPLRARLRLRATFRLTHDWSLIAADLRRATRAAPTD